MLRCQNQTEYVNISHTEGQQLHMPDIIWVLTQITNVFPSTLNPPSRPPLIIEVMFPYTCVLPANISAVFICKGELFLSQLFTDGEIIHCRGYILLHSNLQLCMLSAEQVSLSVSSCISLLQTTLETFLLHEEWTPLTHQLAVSTVDLLKTNSAARFIKTLSRFITHSNIWHSSRADREASGAAGGGVGENGCSSAHREANEGFCGELTSIRQENSKLSRTAETSRPLQGHRVWSSGIVYYTCC